MAPSEFVRRALAEYRKEGLPFIEAWSRALQALPRMEGRKEWLGVLRWARPFYEAAYNREPQLDCSTVLALAPVDQLAA